MTQRTKHRITFMMTPGTEINRVEVAERMIQFPLEILVLVVAKTLGIERLIITWYHRCVTNRAIVVIVLTDRTDTLLQVIIPR